MGRFANNGGAISGGSLAPYIEYQQMNILNNGENTFNAVNGSSVIDLWKTTF